MRAGLTIGDFSRITHLSVKTLLTEHEIAVARPVQENYLVGPADTDESSAWRTEIRLADLPDLVPCTKPPVITAEVWTSGAIGLPRGPGRPG